MPTNKPMKVQFMEVDGRTIPAFLPQHWNGDDWAVTGDENPLPTAGYGMTESGVWIPRKVTDEGHDLTQVTGRNVEEVFEREVRQNIDSQAIEVPQGARGVYAFLRIEGATGTFEEGEGIKLLIVQSGRETTAVQFAGGVETKRSTSSADHGIWMYPGATRGDFNADVLGSRYISVAGVPVTSFIYVSLRIAGTFEEDEGFDCRVYLNWLY